jgi:polyisoprenoid-binding protein YceI
MSPTTPRWSSGPPRSPWAGSGYTLAGNPTINGVTQPVTFNTTYNGSQVFPMDQSTHYGFIAGATMSRGAFEVSYGVPMVADEVVLQLEAQFIKPAPSG